MVAKNFDTSEVEKSLALVTGASQLPDEELNGESTRVYQFTSDVTGDGSMITTSKIWVRDSDAVSYTHLRGHETVLELVCRLRLEKNKHNGSILVLLAPGVCVFMYFLLMRWEVYCVFTA